MTCVEPGRTTVIHKSGRTKAYAMHALFFARVTTFTGRRRGESRALTGHDLIGTSSKRSSARRDRVEGDTPTGTPTKTNRPVSLSATRARFQLADRDVPINGGDVSTDCTGGTRRCGRPLQDFYRARARLPVHDKSGSFRNSKARSRR